MIDEICRIYFYHILNLDKKMKIDKSINISYICNKDMLQV